jgi:hypothetical protein
MAAPVASPLTLVMTSKSALDHKALKQLVEGMQSLPSAQNPIRVALNKLGIVHFARFVFLGDDQLAIITTYDGGFEEYIDAFIKEIGGVFDKLFAHVKDAPPLPVAQNRQAFLDYVKKHDVPCAGPLFCAYPDLKVLDVLTLQREKKAGS